MTRTTKITNCHTHIFLIDHVPNEFGKSLIPWPLYKIFTIKFIKWYYKNLTRSGNPERKRKAYERKQVFYALKDILKKTVILWIIWGITYALIKWFLKIFLGILKWDQILQPDLRELVGRYLIMARFAARYQSQRMVFEFLQMNYPPDTDFIVLPMDMDYMGAGQAKIGYRTQLNDLIDTSKKVNLKPFAFLDPRRIRDKKNPVEIEKPIAQYVKEKIKEGVIKGIKLYPALGYWPFDPDLIPSFEFAAEYQVPIMTHCIAGTVFYRGKKESQWEQHPIFEHQENGVLQKLPFLNKENKHWTKNFTHPLNYHCLLDPDILSAYLGRPADLSKLKICLAHFGGTDQWLKYQDDTSKHYNNKVFPDLLQRYQEGKNTLTHGGIREVWWNASWLSIIYDLIVRYENVYTDVSYMIYNSDLYPTLKYLLQDEKVRHRILFGTDFYLVAQKNSDKVIYQNIRSYLGEELFKLIAEENPRTYLQTKNMT